MGLSELTRERLREVPAPTWARQAWRFTDEALEFSSVREAWGPGPWQDEPDRVEWRHASGVALLAVRNHFGSWCGYVGLAPGHRYYGATMGDAGDLHVHGGVTYADQCRMLICHEPDPGEADELHWLGFDCCHAFDFAPGFAVGRRYFERRLREHMGEHLPGAIAVAEEGLHNPRYRDLGFVRAETESLAYQLAKLDGPGGD